jgi:hypothetical protein
MAKRKPEVLGTVSAPSGALFLIDFGFLELWCHDRKPVMPPGVLSSAEDTADANAGCDFRIDGPDAEKCGKHWGRQWHPRFHFDIPKHGIDTVRKNFAEFVAKHGYDATLTKLRARITHRQRIADALEHGKGAGQVFFQGIEGFTFAGVPADTEMLVTGECMGGKDRAHSARWRWVNLEVRPGAKAASEAVVGRVLVDRARLMFADIDALRDWVRDPAAAETAGTAVVRRACNEFGIRPLEFARSALRAGRVAALDLPAEAARLEPLFGLFRTLFPTGQARVACIAVAHWIELSREVPAELRAAFQLEFVLRCVRPALYRELLNEPLEPGAADRLACVVDGRAPAGARGVRRGWAWGLVGVVLVAAGAAAALVLK